MMRDDARGVRCARRETSTTTARRFVTSRTFARRRVRTATRARFRTIVRATIRFLALEDAVDDDGGRARGERAIECE